VHPTHIQPTPNPAALYPFFCDHGEKAARREDCEAAHGEGDEATKEGLLPHSDHRKKKGCNAAGLGVGWM